MPAERDPAVSVIVVCTGRSGDLQRCLQALLGAGDPAPELIVVDTADDEAAGLAAAFREVKLVRSPPDLGMAAGANLGLAHASGEYVALVAEDTVVAPDWIRGLVRFLEAHPDAAAAGGKAYDWSDQQPVGARHNPWSSHVTIDPATCYARTWRNRPDQVREVATLPGWALMLRRRALDEVGPLVLEPDFVTGYEETDLCLRAAEAGWSTVVVVESRVTHVGGASTGVTHKARKTPLYLLASRRHYFLKNHGWRTLVAANLAYALGFAAWQVRRRLERKPLDERPPLGGFVRYNFNPLRPQGNGGPS